MLSHDELEIELSKLRDKWAKEFDNLFDFSGDNMCIWTIEYVNHNHNIFGNIYESWDDLLEIEKEVFQIKFRQEITIPPMWDYVHK